jgi:hypothetical protein
MDTVIEEFLNRVGMVAAKIDDAFNPDQADRHIGFILLVFPINTTEAGSTIVTSNGISQADVAKILTAQAEGLATEKNTIN